MAKINMPGLSSFKDRHGKIRWRYRSNGRTVSIAGQPGDKGFIEAYQAAVDGVAKPSSTIGIERIPAGSIAHMMTAYYESRAWSELRPVTQENYRGILERFRIKYGKLPANRLGRVQIARIMETLADKPNAANNLVKCLRAVFRQAVRVGLLQTDPTRDVELFKIDTDGHPPWTLEDCAKFEAYHASGTKQRLAYELLRHTGQRRGDIVKLGWQHISNGRIAFTQGKTGQRVDMLLPPPLAAELSLHPRVALSFLATETGRERSAKAFGGWLKEACIACGITDKSAHGLRKTKAIEMANAGLSPHDIAAITGHNTLKEIERYTKAFDRTLAADRASAAIYGKPVIEETTNKNWLTANKVSQKQA